MKPAKRNHRPKRQSAQIGLLHPPARAEAVVDECKHRNAKIVQHSSRCTIAIPAKRSDQWIAPHAYFAAHKGFAPGNQPYSATSDPLEDKHDHRAQSAWEQSLATSVPLHKARVHMHRFADNTTYGGSLHLLGQRRMHLPKEAPSKSYLKLEEAYGILGTEPNANDMAVDLGAAPGGWSFSLAQKGARVIAVDNGKLKKGAAQHRNIQAVRADAFAFEPDRPVDWMVCDVITRPQRSLQLLHKWLEHKWCRFAVVTLKTGYADQARIGTEALYDPILQHLCSTVIVRQLYHNRDEITVMVARR